MVEVGADVWVYVPLGFEALIVNGVQLVVAKLTRH
jgi:hypothetical protein